MNYWPRWIGAIKKRTATLSLMQMGAYDRLLDHYYAEEGPLPSDLLECCRIAGAVTKPEQEAVRQVLQRFFVLTDAGHTNERADEEIQIALPKIEAAKANGAKGGRPQGSKKKPTGLSDGLPPATHDEPATKHPHPHIPSTPSEQKVAPRKRRADGPPCPDGVDAQVWADWLTLRAKKRAPITATVLEGARSEAMKAGMTLDAFLRVWCRRGSQGLEADWLKPSERGGAVIPINRQEAQEQRNRAVGDEWLREQEAADASR